LVARQEVRDALLGWSLYIAAAAASLPGLLLLYNGVRSVAESGVEVIARPFAVPLLITASLAAIYLAGWASLAIARPREQGALRLLFFAPVDAASLVAAHAISGLLMFGALLLLTAPGFLIMALIINLPFPPALLAGLLVSPALVAPALGIGLLVSAASPTARSAMLGVVGIMAALFLVQAGYSALMQAPPTSRYYDALLFLRQLWLMVRATLDWISPLALLSEGLDAAARADWRGLALRTASGLVGGVLWLGLAVYALGRRGVLQ
jgi:hypothetical protein